MKSTRYIDSVVRRVPRNRMRWSEELKCVEAKKAVTAVEVVTGAKAVTQFRK